MDKVKVIYYGLPFKAILDSQEEEIDIPDNATVRQVLQLLADRHGNEFRKSILTSDWQLHPITTIQVNGRNIDEIEGLNTKLANNSEVSITVMISTIDGG